MTQSYDNSIILKKNNQHRLNTIIATFGKSDQNSLRIGQFFQLMIDRFYFIHSSNKLMRQGQSQKKSNNKRYLQFKNQQRKIRKYIYHNDKNYQDKIYNQMLIQKTVANKGVIQYPRIMIMDQLNKKYQLLTRLLSQHSISTLIDYQQQIKNLFIIYISENYFSIKKSNRLLLSWRQIIMQNKKMTSPGFVRFLREAQIIPHLISIQQIQQFMSRVIPPVTSEQKQFQFYHSLVEIYNKPDNQQKIPISPNAIPQPYYKGDPGILFFQFQIMLGRIAWQVFPKQLQKKSIQQILKRFFEQNLLIRPNSKMKTQALLNVNRKLILHLKDYYANYQKQGQQLEQKNFNVQQVQDLKNPLILLAQKQQKQIFQAQYANIITNFGFAEVFKVLDKELPPVPPQLQLNKQQPQQALKQKLFIGIQPPPPPVDKNKKQLPKPKKKKKLLKKGQIQPRQFKLEPMPGKPPDRSQYYFKKLENDLQFQTKNLIDLDRGVMSDIQVTINNQVIPCLIEQILYPPEIPLKVRPYIQAAINCHNEQNFILSIENYNKAKQVWKQLMEQKDLPYNIQLYFQYSKGSVFNSAGRDDYALMHYFLCRGWAQSSKLNYVNPDRSLPFCGLGSVFYNMQEYQISLRSFLKAREIREGLLGIQSVDTATTFNNLGCCMFMLQRNKESMSYFKIAHAVFNCELGAFHQRTSTALRNISKCKKGFFNNIPEYMRLWQAWQKTEFGKKKKKKKKK